MTTIRETCAQLWDAVAVRRAVVGDERGATRALGNAATIRLADTLAGVYDPTPEPNRWDS